MATVKEPGENLKDLPVAVPLATGKLLREEPTSAATVAVMQEELTNAATVVAIPEGLTNAATAAAPEDPIPLLPVNRRPLKEEWKGVKAMVVEAVAADHPAALQKDRAAVEEDLPATDNKKVSFRLPI